MLGTPPTYVMSQKWNWIYKKTVRMRNEGTVKESTTVCNSEREIAYCDCVCNSRF